MLPNADCPQADHQPTFFHPKRISNYCFLNLSLAQQNKSYNLIINGQGD
jgi:hypothetical protein